MIDKDFFANKAMYESNEDMKAFVDRYCDTNDVTKEVAFTHLMVSNYREYLLGR